MSARVDSLRNTLDHLALDSRASEDRRYLVSMLRRLGYSDAEIEAEMGPLDEGGSEGRVIEVEYEGPAPGADRSAAGRETTFQVAQPGDDGLTFRLSGDDAPAGAGVEEVEATDLSGVESDLGDWGEDFEQADRDDFTSVEGDAPDDFGPSGEDDPFTFSETSDDEELVEFRAAKRPDAAVAAGWQEAGDAEAAGWTEDTTPEWNPEPEPEAAPAEDAAWDAPADSSGWDTAPAEGGEWEVVEDDAQEPAWPEAEPETAEAPEEETAWPVAEPVAEEPAAEPTAWPEPEPMEEPVPEPVQNDHAWEDADAWDNAPATETAPEPEPAQEADDTWAEATPADLDVPESYHHGEYSLYTREVQLSTGRKQRIYFFAKNEPQSGDPSPLPDGYEVIENEKTGLPFLRRKR